jgi:hypothetical protein
MEEKTQRAVINHVHSASLAERLRLNVRSLHTCRAYYQSYACNKVSLLLGSLLMGVCNGMPR